MQPIGGLGGKGGMGGGAFLGRDFQHFQLRSKMCGNDFSNRKLQRLRQVEKVAWVWAVAWEWVAWEVCHQDLVLGWVVAWVWEVWVGDSGDIDVSFLRNAQCTNMAT